VRGEEQIVSTTHFSVSAAERHLGALSKDKLSQIHESFQTIGFAVVADLIPKNVQHLLFEAAQEDVLAVRQRDELTMHERHTGPGHLQLGPRRYGAYVDADLVANQLIESVIAELLGEGAWLGFYNGNVNCPGSGFQPLHFDRPFSWKTEAEAKAAGQSWPPPTTTVSCSVALSPITEATGATEIYPGTHREIAVTKWQPREQPGNYPELVSEWGPPASMTIPAGGVCFRDPRMWHRGVPNPSASPRPMLALTYHSGLSQHQTGLLVDDMSPADKQRCDEDPALKLLQSGEIGDGRLVFDESARRAFESDPSAHGIYRNARFVTAPETVNHFLDAHLLGGARVVQAGEITPYPNKAER
jgi:hypothetical protein